MDRDSHQQQFVGGGVGQTGGCDPNTTTGGGSAELGKAQREVIAQMVPQAKDAGIALTGPDGRLKALTAQIVETALAEELNERLGYDEHDPVGRGTGNSRNGTRSKTVITDNVGVIQIEVPWDRKMVFSLFAKGVDDR